MFRLDEFRLLDLCWEIEEDVVKSVIGWNTVKETLPIGINGGVEIEKLDNATNGTTVTIFELIEVVGILLEEKVVVVVLVVVVKKLLVENLVVTGTTRFVVGVTVVWIDEVLATFVVKIVVGAGNTVVVVEIVVCIDALEVVDTVVCATVVIFFVVVIVFGNPAAL